MRMLDGNELRLYGPVGYIDGAEGFTSSDVIDALAEIGRDTDVTVRINSGGGWAHEGVAIYNALARHGGRVVVTVDGVAASAASLIAMAGDEIIVATGALMMIHDPSLITVGTSVEHGRSIHQLEVTAAAMAAVYAKRTRATLTAIRAAMAAETWLTGDEAVASGFATRTGSVKAKAAAAFDYAAYEHAPLTSIAAMQAQARADSPDAVAARPGWVKAAARLNGGRHVPGDAPHADERATAIREAAKARGVVALGEDLIAGKLPVKQALGALYRLPKLPSATSAIPGAPSMAEIAAGRWSPC